MPVVGGHRLLERRILTRAPVDRDRAPWVEAAAGRDVHRVRRLALEDLRPSPVAWVPADKRAELVQLLEWLGVTQVREHHADGLGELAVLDLPDFDSVAVEHRARVDALLPKVDAVAWVLDPEKYKDEVVHDAYLRTWAPRVGRQLVILNRADLLAPEDVAQVVMDVLAMPERTLISRVEMRPSKPEK